MSAQVNKRGSESKYVSVFADSRPDVDVTFRDPLLTRPTSHYVVGVDNLTVSSRALSMIEPVLTAHHTDLIRVVRKPQRQANGDHRGIPIYANSANGRPAGDETFLATSPTKRSHWRLTTGPGRSLHSQQPRDHKRRTVHGGITNGCKHCEHGNVHRSVASAPPKRP